MKKDDCRTLMDDGKQLYPDKQGIRDGFKQVLLSHATACSRRMGTCPVHPITGWLPDDIASFVSQACPGLKLRAPVKPLQSNITISLGIIRCLSVLSGGW